VEAGGSSDGAGRVCGNLDRGSPVTIGDMSRDWKDKEAVADGKFPFVRNCVKGDPTRSAIQVDVAIDGLSVATYGGKAADNCINTLGGLTMDQLRWIFSSYNEEELIATGWNASALKNSDGNPSTHLWSELDERCEAIEIRISGPDDESGTYEYFAEAVLSDHENGEEFGSDRPTGYFWSELDEDLVQYISIHKDAAITYLGFAYYYQNRDILSSVAVQNDAGDFVAPVPETIGNGSYNPLSRRIFMNVLNERGALEDSVPFIKFGLGSDGSKLVETTGYLAIPDDDKDVMIERLTGSPYNEPDYGLSDGAISGIVICSVIFALLVGYGVWRYCKYLAANQDFRTEDAQHGSGVTKAKASRDMVQLLSSLGEMEQEKERKKNRK